jgi:hypothetical protein
MNKIEFNKQVDERIRLIQSVLQKKGAEYANDKDVFHNFEEGTKMSFHDTREMVAWEYMMKHIISIKDMISNKQSYSEHMIREKFGDAINYLILIEAMMLESNGIQKRFCNAVKEASQKAERKLEQLRTEAYERGIDQMGLPKLPSNGTPDKTSYPIDKLKLQQLPHNYDEWYYSSY